MRPPFHLVGFVKVQGDFFGGGAGGGFEGPGGFVGVDGVREIALRLRRAAVSSRCEDEKGKGEEGLWGAGIGCYAHINYGILTFDANFELRFGYNDI